MDASFEEVMDLIKRRWKDKPSYLEALYIYFRNYALEAEIYPRYGGAPVYRIMADEDIIMSEIKIRNPKTGEDSWNDIKGIRKAYPSLNKIADKLANYIEDAYGESIEKLVDRRIKDLPPEDRKVIDSFGRFLVDRFTPGHTLPSSKRDSRTPDYAFLAALESSFPNRGKEAYRLLHRVGLISGADYLSYSGATEKTYYHYHDILPSWSRKWIAKNYGKTFLTPKSSKEDRCRICGKKLSSGDLNLFGYSIHRDCFQREIMKVQNIWTNDDNETEILHDFLAAHVLDFMEIPQTEVNVGERYKFSHPTIGQKSIDAVGRTEGGDVWILEIKDELNGDAAYKAIGQVIVYSYLYLKEHPGIPEERIKLGIICGAADDKEIIEICQKKGITVFAKNRPPYYPITLL